MICPNENKAKGKEMDLWLFDTPTLQQMVADAKAVAEATVNDIEARTIAKRWVEAIQTELMLRRG